MMRLRLLFADFCGATVYPTRKKLIGSNGLMFVSLNLKVALGSEISKRLIVRFLLKKVGS